MWQVRPNIGYNNSNTQLGTNVECVGLNDIDSVYNNNYMVNLLIKVKIFYGKMWILAEKCEF